jgi:oligopeptidase B
MTTLHTPESRRVLNALSARMGRREALRRLAATALAAPLVPRSAPAAAQATPEPAALPSPPIAPTQPDPLAGVNKFPEDPYRWLEDPTDPEVIAYLEAENAYTEAVMAPTRELQTRLYDEIIARVQQTDVSYPVKIGPYFYYTRYEEGADYEIICRKLERLDAAEEIVLDVNEIATETTLLGNWEPSPDHRYFAYLINEGGGIDYSVVVKDLQTGQTLPDRLELSDSSSGPTTARRFSTPARTRSTSTRSRSTVTASATPPPTQCSTRKQTKPTG